MVSRVIPVDDFDLVVFGATGDLAQRKILPALFRRFVAGQIPESSRIIGARPYAKQALRVMSSIAKRVDPEAHPLLRQSEVPGAPPLLVVIHGGPTSKALPVMSSLIAPSK